MSTKRPAALSAETLAFRVAVFEHAAEIVEERGLPDVTVVDPAEVAARVRDDLGLDRVRPARVARLLATPSRFSPFVDEVAVERALAFDVDVLASLSDLEWQTVVGRLAAMPDPWDYASVRPSLGSRKKASGSGWSIGDLRPAVEEDFRTERRRRFEEAVEREPLLMRRLQDGTDLARKAAA